MIDSGKKLRRLKSDGWRRIKKIGRAVLGIDGIRVCVVISEINGRLIIRAIMFDAIYKRKNFAALRSRRYADGAQNKTQNKDAPYRSRRKIFSLRHFIFFLNRFRKFFYECCSPFAFGNAGQAFRPNDLTVPSCFKKN